MFENFLNKQFETGLRWLLRIHPSVQETQVRSPVREDSTCCGAAQLVRTATEPLLWSLGAAPTEPTCGIYWSPRALVIHDEGGHRSEQPVHPNEGKAHLATETQHNQKQIQIKLLKKKERKFETVNKQANNQGSSCLCSYSGTQSRPVFSWSPCDRPSIMPAGRERRTRIPFLTCLGTEVACRFCSQRVWAGVLATQTSRDAECPGGKGSKVWSMRGWSLPQIHSLSLGYIPCSPVFGLLIGHNSLFKSSLHNYKSQF